MTRFLPFEMGHYDFFHPDTEYEDLWAYLWEANKNGSIDMISVMEDDTMLCIAGCTEVRKGTGEVWLLVDRRMTQFRKAFVKAIRRLIEEYLKTQCGLSRIQMCTDVNYPERSRFAEFLGFVQEGTMKMFFNNTDHHLYARLL
jgi:hypothetical protein